MKIKALLREELGPLAMHCVAGVLLVVLMLALMHSGMQHWFFLLTHE